MVSREAGVRRVATGVPGVPREITSAASSVIGGPLTVDCARRSKRFGQGARAGSGCGRSGPSRMVSLIRWCNWRCMARTAVFRSGRFEQGFADTGCGGRQGKGVLVGT